MNAWLSEDTANYIVNEWGYGHSNAKVMATYAPEDIEWAGLAPVSVPVLAQLPMDITLRERQIAEFEKIKAGF
jgi:spermidine/putrescine transport system substrate-binding protein